MLITLLYRIIVLITLLFRIVLVNNASVQVLISPLYRIPHNLRTYAIPILFVIN